MKRYITIEGKEYLCGTMFCIGQNYAKHSKEMGSKTPSEPIVFLKPGSSLAANGSEIELPSISNNVHHETELVVVIGKDCRRIKKEEAVDYIAGYAVGLDLTLRDVQEKAKQNGHPWATAKGFAQSAPLSSIVPQERFGREIPYFELKLYVNGALKQSGSTKDMERSVGELLEYLSGIFELTEGDLLFTGTPEGVGTVNHGDVLRAELVGFEELEVKII